MRNTGGSLILGLLGKPGRPLIYQKPATSVEAQADVLSACGLVSEDRAEVIRYLRAIGYYRLSAYWLPFESPAPSGATRAKTFRSGVRFQDVLDLYIFDRKLRLLVMEAIERIDVAVRSSWTNRHPKDCAGPVLASIGLA